jgi:hypothetical protein
VQVGTPDTRPYLQREVVDCREYTAAAALPRVPAEAGAREEVDGHWESWGTGVAAVVAGTGAEFGA